MGSYSIITKVRLSGEPCVEKKYSGHAKKQTPAEWEVAIKKEEDFLRTFSGHQRFVQIKAVLNIPGELTSILLEQAKCTLSKLCPAGMTLFSYSEIREPKALDYAKQIAEGMEYMHRHNVIHMDFHQDNILVFEHEAGNVQLKICDFGSSRLCKLGDKLSAKERNEVAQFIFPPELKFSSLVNDNYVFSHSVDVYSYGMMIRCLISSTQFASEQSIVKTSLETCAASATLADPVKRPTAAKILTTIQHVVSTPIKQ